MVFSSLKQRFRMIHLNHLNDLFPVIHCKSTKPTDSTSTDHQFDNLETGCCWGTIKKNAFYVHWIDGTCIHNSTRINHTKLIVCSTEFECYLFGWLEICRWFIYKHFTVIYSSLSLRHFSLNRFNFDCICAFYEIYAPICNADAHIVGDDWNNGIDSARWTCVSVSVTM